MPNQTRVQRFEIFKAFNNSAKKTFTDLHKQDLPKVQKYDDYYMFIVCPGGRNGGINNRITEIFYGLSMPYDYQNKINNDLSVTKVPLQERGASLLYSLDDLGYCLVAIYPPETDYTKSIEQGIAIERSINPIKLLNKKTLRKHLNFFNSYMEVQSIEGNPNLTDKLRCLYLRFFKHLIIDNKVENNTKVWKLVRIGFKWFIYVGLSGTVISILIYILSK